MEETKVQKLLGAMTLEEKIALTIGQDLGSTNSIERLGIASITLQDGPHGIRRRPADESVDNTPLPSTCFPTSAALASSWDILLVEKVGQAIAEECLALDAQVLLGPGVNIKRTPLCGRNFERRRNYYVAV